MNQVQVQCRGPVCSAALLEILLTHFQAATLLPIPGGDGLTLEDAVSCYPLGIAAGLLPSWEELLRVHPELAEEIRAVLARAGARAAP
jgi:hypothetical protein